MRRDHKIHDDTENINYLLALHLLRVTRLKYFGLGWQMVYTDFEYVSISYETSKTTQDYHGKLTFIEV